MLADFILDQQSSPMAGIQQGPASPAGPVIDRSSLPWSERLFDRLEAWGSGIATSLQTFSRYSPSGWLVEGLRISWREVAGCFGWIGLAWGGSLAVLALLLFRRRELARVQV